MNGNESMPSGGSPGDGLACMVGAHDLSVLDMSVLDKRALIEDGQRWRAYFGARMPLSSLSVQYSMLKCAACDSADVRPVPLVDPRTARVVEWSVLGDARDFAFVCDGCASASDNFDRMAWINERVNEAHKLAGSNSLARAICVMVDEFAELLAVHYAGVEE